MRNSYNAQTVSIAQSEAAGRFMSKVYRWMTLGVGITSVISMLIAQNPQIVYEIVSNRVLFWGLIIAQFGLVIWLSSRIEKMSGMQAIVLYLLYASLTGVTLSTLSLAYTASSIQSAFATAACSFAGLSAFGYFTKKDLGPIGTFCHMGLYGLIGFTLLSWFFPSMIGGQMGMVYGLVGIMVFAGLTAYDTQKIKSMHANLREGSVDEQKGAIMGALTLYLDFLNLFLFLLRFMGGRKD